jgi:hypothetical protein
MIRIGHSRGVHIFLMASLCLLGFSVATTSAQPRMALADPRILAQRTSQVFDGPDPDAIYMKLQSGKPQIQEVALVNQYLTQGEVFVHISGFVTLMSPGDPMLPYQVYQIALPPDADPASLGLSITRIETKDIEGQHRVAAAPPWGRCQDTTSADEALVEMETWGVGKRITDGKNTVVYGEDAFYPSEHCVLTYGGQLRKWKIATITFYPVRYNPVSMRLVLAKIVELKITFSRDDAYLTLPEVKRLLPDETMDHHARELLLNFERAKPWYQAPVLKDSGMRNRRGGGSDDPDYVIITTEATFTQNTGAGGKIDEFCFHKETLGFEVMVVTEHTTRTVDKLPTGAYTFNQVAGAGGYEDVTGVPAPAQRPEHVYKWLRDNYLVLGIEYVLLIGDPDPDNAGADHVGDLPMKVLTLTPGNDVPSDFYFAELTGNWDLDGDGTAGEYLDDKGVGGVEFFGDIIVGRIPYYDEDQDGNPDYGDMNAILDKIITYENAIVQNEPWRRGVLTSCPYVADTDHPPDGIKDAAKYEWSEKLRDDVASPPVWDWHRIYEEAYPGLSDPAEVETGCSDAETQAGWNDPGDPNDGRGMVMWMTHGGQTHASHVFNNARCANLDDSKPSIVFMGACHNGKPELGFGTGGNTFISLGYANLKQGAIATLSASRDSYG